MNQGRHWMRVFTWILGILLGFSASGTRADVTRRPAESLDELRQRLEAIRHETHTPGLSVALVWENEVEWTLGLGLSSVSTGEPATEETLFRVGSISKGFVALAILQLVSHGKLSLDDSVRRLAPEVVFENPWEATDPLRVADLLEHTTGWDEVSLRNLAKGSNGMKLREALELDSRSRTSRWRPGTLSSYGTSGPAVAAYIVEKLTGTSFEDYVRDKLLAPLGMATATYWEKNSPELATSYHADGTTPYPFWHGLYRPSAALSASAKDMAAYLRFLLARGKAQGREIVPAALLDRMDAPVRNWAVREGAMTGDGLGSGTVVRQGHFYLGHSGSVRGGLALMEYLREPRVGYFYAINSKNQQAFDRIGDEVRSYLTRQLAAPGVAPRLTPARAASSTANIADYAGWYEPTASRYARNDYQGRILGLRHVAWRSGRLHVHDLFTQESVFVPAGGNLLRLEVPRPIPVATSALIPPNGDGRFVYLEGWFKQVPAWVALVRLSSLVACLFGVVAILLMAPLVWFQAPGERRGWERRLVMGPLFCTATLACVAAIGMIPRDDPTAAFGHVTASSLGLFVMTLLFGVGAVVSAGVWFTQWRMPARLWVRGVALLGTSGLLVIAIYLASYGMIGFRSWA
jgi:CubicO group peptidase (beta-lactamase class C family)